MKIELLAWLSVLAVMMRLSCMSHLMSWCNQQQQYCCTLDGRHEVCPLFALCAFFRLIHRTVGIMVIGLVVFFAFGRVMIIAQHTLKNP